MSKYTVNHVCGHSQVVQLYGKETDRERKIEWMQSQDCPTCWGEKKRAEEASMPISMSVRWSGVDVDNAGNPLAEIVLTGGTMPKKEEIKAMGYRWQEVHGGVLDFLSVKRGAIAWTRFVKLIEFLEGGPARDKVFEDAKLLSAKVEIKVTPLDLESARLAVEKKRVADDANLAKEKQILSLEKPTLPAGIVPAGQWNRKIYGKARYGYYIFVDNKKIELSAEHGNALAAYLAAHESYKAAVAKIRSP